jgi:hypothetical protein
VREPPNANLYAGILGRWVEEALEIQLPGLKKSVSQWRPKQAAFAQHDENLTENVPKISSDVQLCSNETEDHNPVVSRAYDLDLVSAVESSADSSHDQHYSHPSGQGKHPQSDSPGHSLIGHSLKRHPCPKVLTVSHLDAFRSAFSSQTSSDTVDIDKAFCLDCDDSSL